MYGTNAWSGPLFTRHDVGLLTADPWYLASGQTGGKPWIALGRAGATNSKGVGVPRRMLLSAVVFIALWAPAAAYAAPKPKYRYKPAHPVVGRVVTFNAKATKCDRKPCRYRWTNARHRVLGKKRMLKRRFVTPGRKNIRLTVRNRRGGRAQVVKRIMVRRKAFARSPRPSQSPSSPGLPLSPLPPPLPAPGPVPDPAVCTVNATTATFGSVFAAAGPGSVICLASGSYGRFTGARKSGRVTIRPQDGAAASISVQFSRTPANIALDGFTITGMEISGPVHDLTIRNSAFTGCAVVRTPEMANANVLLDRNTHLNIARSQCQYDGRLAFPQRNPAQPSGVTVSNSLFRGGTADGILNGSNGTKILRNEFADIIQPASGNEAHSDSIQLYGSSNTLIQGNYFHDSTVAIMAPDGGDHEIIVDNVFVGTPRYRPAIQFGAHIGSRFEHNTVRGMDVHMDSKSTSNPSRDGILRDNVMMNSSFGFKGGGGCVNCAVTNNLTGGAVFAGGAGPTTYAGHKLAAGSPGKGAGTDGYDQGARIP